MTTCSWADDDADILLLFSTENKVMMSP
jgi:hypothetical protein